MNPLDAIIILSVTSAVVLAALAWIMAPTARRERMVTGQQTLQPDNLSFLFENDQLNHASEAAVQAYRTIPGKDDWAAWRERMLTRFPLLPERADENASGTQFIEARHAEDTALISLTRSGPFTQIQIFDCGSAPSSAGTNKSALHRELSDLRRASDTTPHAVWQVDTDGRVTWYNAAYEDLYQKIHGDAPQAGKPLFAPTVDFSQGKANRVCAKSRNDDQQDWYDLVAIRAGDVTVFHATDINAVVKSEAAQRNFVQTLAKTFAQLSIGLAIFDRNGQLALFNPALIDLTGLPADFLSGRPTLLSFFDRMRENRRMPEPKNYHSWRQQIAEVIAAATDGRYQETWTLETGQTYRVHGRPHPDGAIAFLIEDISAEVSLTRNFRAELELGQSLMDSFDEAIVVFSPTGILTFCNLAYRKMWNIDPDSSFADVTIADSVVVWQNATVSGVTWNDVTDFVFDYGEKDTRAVTLAMLDGEQITCTVKRIASGASIIRFTRSSQAQLQGVSSPRKQIV